MTYQELLDHLLTEVTGEQLAQDITIRIKDIDEYFPVTGLHQVMFTDVLDKDHLFLEIDA